MADVVAADTAIKDIKDKTAAPEAPAPDTQQQQEQKAGDSESVGKEASDAPQVTFKVQYGKHSQELKRPATSTIADLKAEVERVLSIPPTMQKLMYKGLLKNDTDTLEKVGIKNGAKVLLIGSSQADIAAAKAQPAAGDGSKLTWDEGKEPEDITKQTQHAKIIGKGVPEDAMPGIKDRQVPLPDTLLNFNNMYNSTGSKVRLTFKPESQQLWIASATSTQKIPYSSVTKIESWPISEHEGYSVVALHLGSGGASKYWLYFFPSQYVSGVKIRLLGVHALL